MYLGLRTLLILFWATLSFGDDYHLFKNRETTREYTSILNKIIAGELRESDQLIFSDGSAFPIKRFLGNGGTTAVIELIDGRVLRIPLPNQIQETQAFYDGMKNISRKTQQRNLPIVSVDFQKSRPPEYVLVEKLDIRFDLNDFRKDVERKKWENLKISPNFHLNDCEIQKIWSQLALFGAELYEFTYIQDLHDSNIVYLGDRWVVSDVGKIVVAANDYPGELQLKTNVLNNFHFVPDEVTDLMENIIWERRLQDLNQKDCRTPGISNILSTILSSLITLSKLDCPPGGS